MSEPNSSSLSTTTILRIIVAAMLLGVLVFAGIVAFKRLEMTPPEPTAFDYIVHLLICFQFIAAHILPQRMLISRCRTFAREPGLKGEVLRQQLESAFVGTRIVGSALSEAACFVALVLLLQNSPNYFWTLIIIGVCQLSLRLWETFSLERYLERMIQFIEEQRQFGVTPQHENNP